jgi:hypothetical protein
MHPKRFFSSPLLFLVYKLQTRILDQEEEEHYYYTKQIHFLIQH